MAFSLVFYNAILLLSTLFVWLSEKASTPMQRKVCTLIAFLIVFLPAALRYEIGIDYFSYKIIFENIRDGLDPFWQSKMEPGFYFLNWIVIQLGASFELLIALVAFIITAVLFKAYPARNKALFHIVLWSVIYVETFNTLRSMLAGVVLLYAVMNYVKSQKIYRYYVFVLIAALFHKSAILFFIIPLLSNRSLIKSLVKVRILLPMFIIIVLIFGRDIINAVFNSSLTSLLGFARYADGWYNKDVEIGTGLGVFLILLILIYALILPVRKVKKENAILFVIVLCTAISVVLASYVTIFYRIKLLFIIGLPIAVYLISTNKRGLISTLVISALIMLNIFDFNRTIWNGSTDYFKTCRGARITPYISVFNKEDSTRDPHLTRFARWCDAYFEKN